MGSISKYIGLVAIWSVIVREQGSLKGERSFVNNNEDSVTMGIEAGSDPLKIFDVSKIALGDL